MESVKRKYVLNELANRIEEELLNNNSPMSIHRLQERIREIWIDPKLDPDSEDMQDQVYAHEEEEIHYLKPPSHYISIKIKYQDFLDTVDNNLDRFYESEKFIGRKQYLNKLLYKICINIISEKNNFSAPADEIADRITEYALKNYYMLPAVEGLKDDDFYDDQIKSNYRNYINARLIEIAKEYHKVFSYNFDLKTISLRKKSDLKRRIEQILYSHRNIGESDFTKNQKIKLSTKILIQALNERDDEYYKDYQEPVELNDLLLLVNEYPEYLSISANGEFIIYNILLQVKALIKRNQHADSAAKTTGERLYFYSFVGQDFPFDAAKEYVKLRKTIYIKYVKWNTLDQLKTELLVTKKTELGTILDKTLDNSYKPGQWIKNNLLISWIDSYDTPLPLDNFYKYLLKQVSPVFNLQDNPDNIFRHSLEEILNKS